GQWIVAGDHHGPDSHATELAEPLADAALHDVLELDGAEDGGAVGHDERRRPFLGDPVHDAPELNWHAAAEPLDVSCDRVGRALPNLTAVHVDAAHPRLRRERHERRPELLDLALADPVLLLAQDDHA